MNPMNLNGQIPLHKMKTSKKKTNQMKKKRKGPHQLQLYPYKQRHLLKVSKSSTTCVNKDTHMLKHPKIYQNFTLKTYLCDQKPILKLITLLYQLLTINTRKVVKPVNYKLSDSKVHEYLSLWERRYLNNWSLILEKSTIASSIAVVHFKDI